jgi:hypothetical protein
MASLAIPLFATTVGGLVRARTRRTKCVAAAAPLIGAVAASQWAFAPEIPHSGIVTACAVYSITILIATWLRNSEPDVSFIKDPSLPVPVRLEGLKSAITLWQGIAIATCAGFLAGIVPWPVALMNANARVVTEATDLFLLNSLSVLQVGLMTISFVSGPILEAVGTVMKLTARFSEIR